MDNRVNRFRFQFSTPSFTPVSGAISGTTPKVSSAITVKGVESVAIALATTSTANGLWTIQVSNDESATKVWTESASFPGQPTYPTGAASSGTPVIPTWGYNFMQITFTPSAGAGNATATVSGKVQSAPIDVCQNETGSLLLVANATDTLAGTWLPEVSNDWSGMLLNPAGRNQVNKLVIADGSWGTYLVNPALAAKVASTLQAQTSDLGINTTGSPGTMPYGAFRLAFTPTAGSGTVTATGIFK